MMLAYQPIRSLATINIVAYQGSAAAKRIFSVIDAEIKIKQENHLPDLKIKECNISFKDVSFNYKNTDKKAIKNINMDIQGGSMTAFVLSEVPTTVFELLQRFYDPQQGGVLDEIKILKKIH